MSEYINKNALAEKILVREALIKEERNADYENMETYNGMIRGLVEAQRLMLETDTIEIVRCKDCKYANKERLPQGSKWFASCDHFNTHSVMADDYCNYAKRKEAEE